MPAKRTNLPSRKRTLPKGIYFQKGKYLIRYKHGGKFKGESFDTVTQAEEALAARKTDLHRGELRLHSSKRRTNNSRVHGLGVCASATSHENVSG